MKSIGERKTMKSHGYAAHDKKSPLVPFDFDRREPGPNDVVVEIDYCGICHSDIHQVRDEWGGSIYPMVPGHEIVGHVTAVGASVTKFKKGDLAGVGVMVDSCRICENCRAEAQPYCVKGMVGTYNARDYKGELTFGGYSNNIVIDEKYTFTLSPKLNLAAVAPQHPEQKYVFFDDELALPNVLSVKYAQNEGSYLAGVLAAIAATDKTDFPLSSGDPKIAVVAGMDLPVIQDFILGFKQGAATIAPDVQVQVIFIGNFNDAQKAYDLTKTAIENGANVVYNVAGPAGLGILKGAADSNKYAIGVDSDQNGLHPKNVLASMIKQIGN